MTEQEEFELWVAETDKRVSWKAWQACAERKDAIIEQQAAELAALRLEAKSAVLKERERCLNIIQNNQCRNGYHNHEGTTLGHYDMKMIDEIKKG